MRRWSPRRQDVENLDGRRERHGEIDTAARNMEVEASAIYETMAASTVRDDVTSSCHAVLAPAAFD
jgi:hypothetical protein